MNIDEITAVRQHFQEFGTYTKLPYGSPQWVKFWKQESERCVNGYHIGSDFIPGYFYDYLNYSPILITKAIGEATTGQQRADRIEEFPNFWDGDYEFFHYLEEAENSGNHAMLLGSRGKGKSYKGGSMLCRNYFHIPKSKSYAFASAEEYLTKDGIITKAWDIMDFRDVNTPWGKRRHYKNKDMHRRASYQTIMNGKTFEEGFKSEIIASTVGDSVQKLRGKRGKLIILEEIGKFPNVHKGWNILRPSMEEGKRTFGLILGIGTGGSDGADFEGAEEMFHSPRAYKIHPIKNKWEEGKENQDCAYFWSAAQNYAGAYNEETGESNIELAKQYILEDRKIVEESGDPNAVTRRAAEIPLTPSEVMMKISHTHFPINEILKQEAEIEAKPHLYEHADFVGKFEINSDKTNYDFVVDLSLKPLRKRYRDNKQKPGAIIIYQHPIHNDDYIGERYVAGIDSYDHDESSTDSFGSCIVIDLLTNSVVAEYTGRPDSDTFYENCRRLLIYYKAIANIENANKGIFEYFKAKTSYHYIADEPEIVKEAFSNDGRNRTSSRKKGTTPSEMLNAYARKKIGEWLKYSTNNPKKPEELVVHKIRSKTILQELRLWNPKGNFDRVSALCMAILLLLEKQKYLMGYVEESTIKMATKDDWDFVFGKQLGSMYPGENPQPNNIDLKTW
jgi:hypothetical protein